MEPKQQLHAKNLWISSLVFSIFSATLTFFTSIILCFDKNTYNQTVWNKYTQKYDVIATVTESNPQASIMPFVALILITIGIFLLIPSLKKKNNMAIGTLVLDILAIPLLVLSNNFIKNSSDLYYCAIATGALLFVVCILLICFLVLVRYNIKTNIYTEEPIEQLAEQPTIVSEPIEQKNIQPEPKPDPDEERFRAIYKKIKEAESDGSTTKVKIVKVVKRPIRK